MTRKHRSVKLMIATLSTGMLFQVGGCLSTVGSAVLDFNPCTTVLNCDPLTFEFVTSGYEGPGVDFDVDPACTFPPFCTTNDPFVPNNDDTAGA